MRGKIKVDMAIIQPVGNPGCFVLKIIIVDRGGIHKEKSLEFSFLKNCSGRSEQKKGLSIFEAK